MVQVLRLEMEPEFRRIRSRSHEVGSAEGRQEVVECGLVCQVDDGESQAPLIMIAMKEVVIADCGVEQMTRCDAGWILVQVECPDFRKDDSGCRTGRQTIRTYYVARSRIQRTI